MELRQLEVFVAVAETLHFTQASDRLHVAQGAVSQSIQSLERSLGVRLFARTNRKVELTAAGEELLPRARALLRDAQTTATDLRRAARGELGRLRLATMGAATHTFLPQVVRSFRAIRPGVAVEIAEMTPTRQISALKDGLIDVGLARRPPPTSILDVRTQLVYLDEMMLCLPEEEGADLAHTIDLGDFRERDFIFYERDEAPELVDLMIQCCQQAGFSPRVVATARLMATIPLMVACGVGVSLVPGSVRMLRQPGVALHRLAQPSPVVPLVAMARPQPTPLARAFLIHLESQRVEIAKQMEVSPSAKSTEEALHAHPPITRWGGGERAS